LRNLGFETLTWKTTLTYKNYPLLNIKKNLLLNFRIQFWFTWKSGEMKEGEFYNFKTGLAVKSLPGGGNSVAEHARHDTLRSRWKIYASISQDGCVRVSF